MSGGPHTTLIVADGTTLALSVVGGKIRLVANRFDDRASIGVVMTPEQAQSLADDLEWTVKTFGEIEKRKKEMA